MNPNLFQVHCTWAAVDGKSIIEAITWSDRSENSDIEENIQAENCLLLECTSGKSNECRLSLQCQPPYVVQQVTVLCEARLLEVYGMHQEYLRTVRCQMVDEMEDMIVFKAEVLLEKPSSECSIKFTGLKSKTSMWLYGVVVHVDLPMMPTSVLLSAAQRFTAQHEQPPPHVKGQINSQMMGLMALLGIPPGAPTHRPSHMEPFQPPQLSNSAYPQIFSQLLNTRLGPQASQQHIPDLQNVQPKVSSNETVTPQMLNNHFSNQSEFEKPNQTELSSQKIPAELTQMWQMMDQSNSGNAMALFANILQQMQASNQSDGVSNRTELEKNSDSINSNLKIVGTEKALDSIKTQDNILKEISPLPEKPTETIVEQVVPTTQVTTEVVTLPEVSSGLQTPVSTAVPSGQVNRVISEPLSEAVAVSKLSGAAVEQISESVVNNLDCSLENLEERLWGKVRNRLQEMEARILNRLEEMLDALREEEDSEPRELQEDIDLDEEEEALSGMDPRNSVLEI